MCKYMIYASHIPRVSIYVYRNYVSRLHRLSQSAKHTAGESLLGVRPPLEVPTFEAIEAPNKV